MLRVFVLFCFFLSVGVASAQEPEYPLITPENVANLTLVAEVGASLSGTISWSPDDEYLAVGTTDGALLYRPMESAQPVRTFESDALER